MNSINEINIKNRTYCFFCDRINIKNFDQNWLKADEKSYKIITIYYIGCATIKILSYLKIDKVKITLNQRSFTSYVG